MGLFLVLIYILMFALVIIGAYFFIFQSFKKQQDRINKQRENISKQVDRVANSISELSPEEFFSLRNNAKVKNLNAENSHFAGVYILHNKTKNMYYVGQGKDVFNRVNSHFTGKGNGDVYADYKYGDDFFYFSLLETYYS